MSHTTHHDDCGCLTANYERRLDAQKEAVASLEAKVATLEAELAEIHVIEAKRALTCDGLRAHANALRDALEKADAAFNAWARDEDGIHPEAWPAVEHLREVLKATPAASLDEHDAEVLERAAMVAETCNRPGWADEEVYQAEMKKHGKAWKWVADAIRALAAQAATHSVPDGTSEVKP